MGMIEEYCICMKKNKPEEFNKICEVNGIYGIYRVEFENVLDRIDKKC